MQAQKEVSFTQAAGSRAVGGSLASMFSNVATMWRVGWLYLLAGAIGGALSLTFAVLLRGFFADGPRWQEQVAALALTMAVLFVSAIPLIPLVRFGEALMLKGQLGKLFLAVDAMPQRSTAQEELHKELVQVANKLSEGKVIYTPGALRVGIIDSQPGSNGDDWSATLCTKEGCPLKP